MFFTQKDLTPEDIMILDTQYALYIWIGQLSNKEDQRLSIKTALEYLQTGKCIYSNFCITTTISFLQIHLEEI